MESQEKPCVSRILVTDGAHLGPVMTLKWPQWYVFLSSNCTIFDKDRIVWDRDRWPFSIFWFRFWQKDQNMASTLSRTDLIIRTALESLSTSVSLLTLVVKPPLMHVVPVTHLLVLLATIQILVQITSTLQRVLAACFIVTLDRLVWWKNVARPGKKSNIT